MTIAEAEQIEVNLGRLNPWQIEVVPDKHKRQVWKCGRRAGKTEGLAKRGVLCFLDGGRIRYMVPTSTQLTTWWYAVCNMLKAPLEEGMFYKNENEHIIERTGTKQRIEGHTAWNVATMRGDWADELHFDEWQMFNEDAWEYAGPPCLADTDGTAVFAFTPPRMGSTEGVSHARDPLHASKLYRAVMNGEKEPVAEWKAWRFTTLDNSEDKGGFLSKAGVEKLTQGMSKQAYRLEILALDDDMPDNALVYRQFNAATQIIAPIAISGTWPIFVGHDFGGANPAAVFLAQDPLTGHMYVFQSYKPGGGYSVAQHVEAFKRLAGGKTVVHRAGGNHQEGEIRQAYAAHGWPIAEPITPQGKPAGVGDRIERMRALMDLNKLFIFSTCSEVVDEILNYSFKVLPDGTISDEIAQKAKYHLMDCLGYALVHTTYETAIKREPVRVVNFARYA